MFKNFAIPAVLIAGFTSFAIVLALPANSGVIIQPVPSDAPCHDIMNRPYEDVIPHPTNCSVFYKCVPDANHHPQPHLQFCPPNLIFNFDKCYCDYPSVAICYNNANGDHQREFFKCAIPMSKIVPGVPEMDTDENS